MDFGDLVFCILQMGDSNELYCVGLFRYSCVILAYPSCQVIDLSVTVFCSDGKLTKFMSVSITKCTLSYHQFQYILLLTWKHVSSPFERDRVKASVLYSCVMCTLHSLAFFLSFAFPLLGWRPCLFCLRIETCELIDSNSIIYYLTEKK